MKKISADAICPVCESVMEKGWIASNKNIYWNTKRPSIFGSSMDSERLTTGFWGPAKVAAYRCRNCRIIRYYPAEFDWKGRR